MAASSIFICEICSLPFFRILALSFLCGIWYSSLLAEETVQAYVGAKLIPIEGESIANGVLLIQDDKILAVPLEGSMSDVSSLAELNQRYSGVTQIIELWFTGYKGPGRMESQGYADSDAAWEMINIASRAFEAKHSN